MHAAETLQAASFFAIFVAWSSSATGLLVVVEAGPVLGDAA